MCDIEAQVQTTKKIKNNFTIILFLQTIFHISYFVLFVFVLSWGCWIWFSISDSQLKHPILKDMKILTPFFFTNWNFSLQTLFLGLSLLHNALEWMGKHTNKLGSRVKYWRDVIFCGMVLPYTLFVTGMFWGVYAIDRELVFPKIYDDVVPWWFNHCVHTNITVVLIVETLLQARRHPTDKKVELILYWTIAFAYAIVYYSIYFATGRWLYQVFGVMNWWQVCLYQLFIWVISYVFYELQFPLNRLIHGPKEADTENVEKEAIDVRSGTTADDIVKEVTSDDNEKVITALKTPTMPVRSWSLKFRSLKNDFDNSRL